MHMLSDTCRGYCIGKRLGLWALYGV